MGEHRCELSDRLLGVLGSTQAERDRYRAALEKIGECPEMSVAALLEIVDGALNG